ncbi:hypothetical protein NW762_013778 [Fusarium torreyae]|uniref:Amine oxidase domain-containing protein n=1 Tax=Fusarium torreyae TaxID=1237075 RepID=A0A9W8RP55_9HYPO|nr:hypothetical protein NW762_013778 [Fusarium torreyae]
MSSTLELVKEGQHLESTSYKYFWARYVQKNTLEYDFKVVKELIEQARKKDPDLLKEIKPNDGIAETLHKTQKITGVGFVPKTPGKLEIGIVGAGVAGLFSAMVFDWLNEHPDLKGELEIKYDILEAAGEERLGGRLYTHQFSKGDPVKTHDYYDVGAMRFPNNDIMKRTFQLFHFLGLDKGRGGLIPYYLDDELDKCPSYFNDVRHFGNPWDKPNVDDPFKINSGLPDNGKIDPKFLKTDPAKLVSEALDPFIKLTKKMAQDAINEPNEQKELKDKFWKHMMAADHQSIRQFLMSDDNPHNKPVRTFNYNTIEWLESATYGTGWYDQALSECVLEELDFGTPKQDEVQKKGVQYWWCLEGGAQRVAKIMSEKIKQPVQFNSQVSAINAHPNDPKRKDPEKYVPVTLSVDRIDPETKDITKTDKKDYFAVFNSTTLGALQRMNLKDAGLLWGTKQAIRSLGYGASCKVAIKFKSPWWQEDPFYIEKGGIAHTDLPLRVCVYPSYNIPDMENTQERSAVLLVSYTWGQDAQRIGALISDKSPENEKQLIKVLLHDLALMHANDTIGYTGLLKKLQDEYETHHAYDWYRDQNMSGAFAYFGPGQYSNMWQEIIKPNAFGQLYMVGEAASSHHAWVVGALESVIRAVYVMLDGLNSHDPKYAAYAKAMNLLSHVPKEGDATYDPNDTAKLQPGDLPKGKPFYPLPEEMPDWQAGVTSSDGVTHDPKDGLDKDKSLAYTTAVVSVCIIESYFELRFGAKVPR